MNTEVKIVINNLLPTEELQCQRRPPVKFDDCVEEEILAKLSNLCIPPYIKKRDENVPICSNTTDGYSALKVFQLTPQACILPCKQLQVTMNMIPVDMIFSTVRKNLVVRSQENGLHIHIPSIVFTSEMVEQYSVISFIADFGGWSGLLLGVSLLGSYVYWYHKVCELCNKKDINLIKWTVGFPILILSLVMIGFISYICIRKLIRNETMTDVSIVNFEESVENFTISICSVESIYSKDPMGATFYIGEDKEFWNNASQLQNKLREMRVLLKTQDLISIYDKKLHKNSDERFYSINVPRFGKFIENCHSYDLKDWKSVEKIYINARREVNIYLHWSGQIINQDLRQGFTIANRLTLKDKYGSNFIEITSSTNTFSLQMLSMIDKDGYTSSFSYDDCILQNVVQRFQDLSVVDFLIEPGKIQFSKGLNETMFDKLNTMFIQRETYDACKHPTKAVMVDFHQNILDDLEEIEISDKTHATSQGNNSFELFILFIILI